MAKVTAKRSDGKTIITITGDAGIESVQETYDSLVKEYKKATYLEVHCHEVEKADVSFVQLLISLIKTAQTDKKTCVLSSMSDTLHELIRSTGYERVCKEYGIGGI